MPFRERGRQAIDWTRLASDIIGRRKQRRTDQWGNLQNVIGGIGNQFWETGRQKQDIASKAEQAKLDREANMARLEAELEGRAGVQTAADKAAAERAEAERLFKISPEYIQSQKDIIGAGATADWEAKKNEIDYLIEHADELNDETEPESFNSRVHAKLSDSAGIILDLLPKNELGEINWEGIERSTLETWFESTLAGEDPDVALAVTAIWNGFLDMRYKNLGHEEPEPTEEDVAGSKEPGPLAFLAMPSPGKIIDEWKEDSKRIGQIARENKGDFFGLIEEYGRYFLGMEPKTKPKPISKESLGLTNIPKTGENLQYAAEPVSGTVGVNQAEVDELESMLDDRFPAETVGEEEHQIWLDMLRSLIQQGKTFVEIITEMGL